VNLALRLYLARPQAGATSKRPLAAHLALHHQLACQISLLLALDRDL
jgi:hypothetical protein